jgi:bile acid:Na+ symporter, BASS family
MVAGVLFPSTGHVLQPYVLVWLGGLLFFNLITLNIPDIVSTFRRPKNVAVLSIVKLIILPLTMYGISYLVYPSLSLPILLLSGISTGLGAPFVVNIVGGNLSLTVGTIIITSFAVPFILPTLVYIFFSAEFSIPILQMIILLSAALFIPLALGWLTKKYSPSIAKAVKNASPIASIIFVVLINLGIFSEFAHYFVANSLFVIQTTSLDFVLFGAYGLAGFLAIRINNIKDKKERISTIIAMTYINNILVAVFAQQFFGKEAGALAAFYNIPYYVGILILKKILKTKV